MPDTEEKKMINIFEIRASLKIKGKEDADLENVIIPKTIKVRGDKAFSFDQLTEIFAGLVEGEYVLEHIVSFRIIPKGQIEEKTEEEAMAEEAEKLTTEDKNGF